MTIYRTALPTTADTGWFTPSLASPELVWRVKTDWTLTEVSRDYQRYTAEVLLREGYPLLRRLLAGDNLSVLDDGILKASRRTTPVPVLETSSTQALTGEPQHFITSLTPLFDHHRLVGIEGRTRDVTLLRIVELSRERRLSELAALSYMTSQVGEARSLEELLHQILQVSLDVVGGYYGSLMLATPERSYRVGAPHVRTVRKLMAWSAQAGATFEPDEYVRVVQPTGTLEKYARQHDLRAAALVPIRLEGKLIGVMTLTSPADPSHLSEFKAEMMFAARHVELTLGGLVYGSTAHDPRQQRDDVLRAFTRAFSRGKLVILSQPQLSAAARLVSERASTSSDRVCITDSLVLPRVRRLVEAVAEAAGSDEDQSLDLALCTTEAATNVLVHGADGYVRAHVVDNTIQVWIEDAGQGIDLVSLARAALLRTYSTKTSMGLGFNLMLELADKVSVYTSPQGTTLILECRIQRAAADPMPPP